MMSLTQYRPRKRILLPLIAAASLSLSACDSKDEAASNNEQAAAQTNKAKQEAAAAKPKVRNVSKELPAVPDFASITDVKQKKKTFFDFLYNLVKRANREVLAERSVIESWNPDKGASQAITDLMEKYRIDEKLSPQDARSELLKRVQVIPASLVLAQGANESAWGTSRFAKQGNNYFGQWCYVKGCGLVPQQRNDGAVHEVADFDHPMDSVRSYILNLNRHYTYDDLRDLRAKEIKKQGYATGLNLAAGLINYSERRMEYVKEIRSMISYNKLDKLDPTMLADIQGTAKEG
ncbi:glucosaminidase domain-containing protein [Oceanobacter kriegii]|uniref:glucosaminidase domain-containing protein n=1 Tax=Oceanobacter kriegii TaxID=64972 RepID=UPI000411AC07|nr:glucosaminidase domain-containing protein [Oceanobacter kriegii]